MELYKLLSKNDRLFLKDKLNIIVEERNYSDDEVDNVYEAIEDFHILKSFDKNYDLTKDGEQALELLNSNIWD
ncbi:hypothetical protein FC84_GL001660 [Lapidilactobacillus dextrinicus DSM 20335]|uniref:Uncharacterized protein n=1 Tax=Lapidilactobacillus dextrinicus DSM 20335 TaxID=1423738 RepID=A0A0R2BIW6_9LACO|nr:hypothetical protein [Lapidilactobacillus dextrinicus]KRM79480.1 hypothetical protein FC84_GL001660 [Lapidilactobacillus dextrinicus DSM 20335]QFG46684.1 hypothetical protein LH506_04155 [Lapidilactobacillus dextrinicus]